MLDELRPFIIEFTVLMPRLTNKQLLAKTKHCTYTKSQFNINQISQGPQIDSYMLGNKPSVRGLC